MNNTVRILVIDDESQENALDRIVNDLRNQLQVNYRQISVLDEDYFNENLSLYDKSKLASKIEQTLKWSPTIILVDYDYGDEAILGGLNGIDVIDMIHHTKRRKVPIILYSADQKKVIRNIINTNESDRLELDTVVEAVNKLMDYKIAKICKRNSYEEEVVRMLKSDITPTPTSILCQLLRENGDRVFNSCCPPLNGKTFNEISELLEEDNNGKANEWLNAILEQVVAYLTKVNE